MGYSSVWKVLDRMVEDLKKRGAEVPPEVVSDLRSAKTLLKSSGTDCIDPSDLQRIDNYLANVEAIIVSKGQELFGNDYVDAWLKRLDVAGRERSESVEEKARFVPGVPRGEKWIRVEPPKDLSEAKIADIAEVLGLSCERQKDERYLIHGGEEALKEFVKRITPARRPRKT